MKRTAKVGIMPEADFRNRMLAAARGERTRAKGEPKIWFSSMRSLADVLNDKNRELICLIAEKPPMSGADLAVKGNSIGVWTK
jgi:predicted transcriptional regulator